MKCWERFETAYAVLRLDRFQMHNGIPDDPNIYVTSKAVYWTPEEAESEVERLNRLNPAGNKLYWWQGTRVRRRDINSPSSEGDYYAPH